MALLLKNTTYVHWQSLEFKSCDILLEEGVAGRMIFDPDEAAVAEIQPEILDCKGSLVMKSFAIGHHHVYSALSRGMPAPSVKPSGFADMLKKVWWRLDKALDQDTIRASALFTAMECALNGSTFVIDHHASPNAVAGSLETIAAAFDEAGLSHLLCYEISDRDGKETAQKGLAETDDYLSHRQGLTGLHASFTVGDETLLNAVALAKKHNTGLHVHIAEDRFDQQDSMERYGMRVLHRFSAAGALSLKGSIFAHGIHLDESERQMLAASTVCVVQNPESNLKNNVGFLNPEGMGTDIMLGTDGMHSDMLRSAKTAFFAGQGYGHPDAGTIYTRFRKVHHYLETNGYKGDGENNLVAMDYNPPTVIGPSNFLSHFIFGMGSKHVLHVISNGKLIVRDRHILTLDRHEVTAFAREMAVRLWKNMEKF
ncbi:MAG: amidohydrolase family protein [Bacteroidales bacterium]|nr:amidohydrolase family protein [Bacteroidales bacterium]